MAKENKPEFALVAITHKMGLIISASGPIIETIIEAIRPNTEDIGLTNGDCPEDGIWIWEGHPVWTNKSGKNRHVSFKNGTYRKPTEQEWIDIIRKNGVGIWPTRNPLKL